MSRKLIALTAPLCLALAAPVAGATLQENVAWILATTDDTGTARADASAMSRRLMAAGFAVTRRENADPAALDLTAQVAPVVVLYFSGPVVRLGDETWLLSAPLEEGALPQGWPLNETVRQMRAAGVQQVVAMVEGCHVPGAGFGPLPARDLAAENEAPYPEDVVFVLSAPAGEDCAAVEGPRLTARLTEALSKPGADFLEAFEQTSGAGWVEARLQHRLAPLVPAVPTQLGDATSAEEMLRSMPPEEAARLRPLWESSGLLVGAANAAAPVDNMIIESASTTIGTRPGQAVVSQAVAGTGEGTGFSLISISAGARIAARQPSAGLPRPSIIVGEIGLETDLPAPEQPAQTEELVDTTPTLRALPRAERVALRRQDSQGFDLLVDSGVFDPPPAELIRLLQTELQAAGCYRGAIDGSWGNGSINGVQAFFRERGSAAPGTQPSNVLYRALLTGDEVTCPAPPVASARPAAASSSRPAASTTTRPTQAQPQQQRPAQQPQTNTTAAERPTINVGTFNPR